jgi:hypothetical protein
MDRLPRPGVLLGSMAGKFQNEDLVPVRASPLAWPRPEEREHLHPLWALLASRHITEGRLVGILAGCYSKSRRAPRFQRALVGEGSAAESDAGTSVTH